MSYKGLMEGWDGDEDECTGHCGACDECLEILTEKGENEYDLWKLEQLSVYDSRD